MLTPIVDEGYDNDVTGGRTPPQRRRGAALEAAILAAAYDELASAGYTNFSVEGVAARARTGKASIYRRWPRKAELVMDAMCTVMPQPAAMGLVPVVGDDITTVEALRQVGTIIAATMSSPAGDAVRAIKFEATVDPDLAALVDERFQAPRRAALQAILRRGIERGEVRPGADSPLIADVLPAVLVHRMVMAGETLDERAVTEIIDEVIVPLVASASAPVHPG